MTDLERAVIDLVRMAIAGDHESARQYARRLLRRAPVSDGPEGDFREGLGELLLRTEEPTPALHRARRATTLADSRELVGAPLMPESQRDRVVQRPRRTTPSVTPGREGRADDREPAGPPPVDPRSSLELTRVERMVSAPCPVLNAEVGQAVQALILERQRADSLKALGVTASRTVLLTGPPGVGKTMTARYLASALQLPLLTVDLAAVMSSFLGRTGQNLRQVLDFARQDRCVLLLDEFDALAKRRDDQSDVGELKRIVNVLLLELESWPEDSLLVAATNHPELLDRAVWRRFDQVIMLPLPDLVARRTILQTAFDGLSAAGATFDASSRDKIPPLRDVAPYVIDACAAVLDGASASDVASFVRNALRSAAIGERDVSAALLTAIRQHLTSVPRSSALDRAQLATALIRGVGATQREVAQIFGVSHVTIGNWLRARAKVESGRWDARG